MALQLYLLKFDRTHFGQGSLIEANPLFSSGRLFSALYIEAKKLDKVDQLMDLVDKDELVISNALYYQNGVYLPKPIGYPRLQTLNQEMDVVEQSRNSKADKKLSYIF